MAELSREQEATKAAPRPRFFFRRLIAFIVDAALAGILAQLLVFPFLGDPDHVRLSGGLYKSSSCWKADTLPPALKGIGGDVPPDLVVMCDTRIYGMENGRNVHLIWARGWVENGIKFNGSKRISFPVDDKGRPVHPLVPDSILQAVLFFFGSIFLLKRWKGQTPGKKLLGLRVAGDPSGYARREIFRQLPLLASTFLSQLAVLMPTRLVFGDVVTAIVIAGGLFVLLFWYYALPLFRWRGAMRYDKVTWVERA